MEAWSLVPWQPKSESAKAFCPGDKGLCLGDNPDSERQTATGFEKAWAEMRLDNIMSSMIDRSRQDSHKPNVGKQGCWSPTDKRVKECL